MPPPQPSPACGGGSLLLRLTTHDSRFSKLISGAANSVDEGSLEASIDRLSQTTHVNVHDVGLRIEVHVPDLLEQGLARDDFAHVTHQEHEQVELPRCELDVTFAAAYTTLHEIDGEILDLQPSRHGRALLPSTEQRFDARKQFR